MTCPFISPGQASTQNLQDLHFTCVRGCGDSKTLPTWNSRFKPFNLEIKSRQEVAVHAFNPSTQKAEAGESL